MTRLRLNLDLTGLIVTIAVGVLLPVMLATAVGIVSLVIARDAGGVVTGVLVISFAATAMGSALIGVVLAGRKAHLARRQADFIANVSHEFRTPLSAIRLYAQTLQSGRLTQDPERTAACLATILRETAWLDVLVDRVLTWRASARDAVPLRMACGTVASALQEAVAHFRSMVTPDGLDLDLSVETRLPVRHDAQALHSVVLNLLLNAYKYTGREKRIGLEARDEDGQVVIAVSDNGIGLSPAAAKRVFQPFYRAAGDGDGSAEGVGLGLTIARYLVRRHGGTLNVRSAPGEGATFTIRLPAFEGDGT